MKKHKHKCHFLTLICVFIVSTNAYSRISSGTIVKLFSGGKIVGTWNAKIGGRIVGSCYVFEENKIHAKKITVCGTFSIEEKK